MLHRFPVILFLLLIVLYSSASELTENQKFETLAKEYIDNLLELQPEWATALGDHRFDDRMNDYSLDGIQESRKLHQKYLDELKTIDAQQLDQQNRIDYQILQSHLESSLFSIDVLREYEWNPMWYNPGSAIYGLIARDFAPLAERMKHVQERLKAIPLVVECAKANLKHPPKIHTETAILQNKGNISLIEKELKPFLTDVPSLQKTFHPIQQKALQALRSYGEWLEKDLLPRADGDFRLGDQKYRRKLRFSLESDISKEDILRRAEREMRRTQEQMYQTALPLYQSFFPSDTDSQKKNNKKHVIRSVLGKLAETHPTDETIVELARHYTQECTEFVRTHNLMTVPDEPIQVIVMPEFRRGVSAAYCDSPGPLEKKSDTFYAISPTPEDWTEQRTLSFYKEYNNYMLQNLTIHEAAPGHYLQLAHANRFHASTPIRAIFSSGTFVEGWAVYAEQLMAEMGHGGPQVKMQQLKMQLRGIINAIIDQKIHTQGMTETEAMDMMMNEGFQEEGEAAAKWRRACLTSTQLATYFVGNMEIKELRKDYQAKMKSKFNMKQFHDTLLSFGSPAPKYVRILMGL